MPPKEQKKSTWMQGLKIFNQHNPNPDTWTVPKKGSAGYKATNEIFRHPALAAQAASPAFKSLMGTTGASVKKTYELLLKGYEKRSERRSDRIAQGVEKPERYRS
jgi:hypothetical protein